MIKTILFLQKLTVGPYTEEVVLELGFEGWTVGPERQVVIEAGVRTCFLGWCSLFGHCFCHHLNKLFKNILIDLFHYLFGCSES